MNKKSCDHQKFLLLLNFLANEIMHDIDDSNYGIARKKAADLVDAIHQQHTIDSGHFMLDALDTVKKTRKN